MPPSPTPAIDLLVRAGVAHVVRAYQLPSRSGRERDSRPDYGLEAAAALGVEAGAMGKTLIVDADGRLAAAVVPVDRTLDARALAMVLGARRAELADATAASRATGSVVGGISPLGMRRALAVIVDASFLDRPTMHVSAGRRGLQVELAPDDLVRVTAARVAAISRSG